jgi:hypothetical protein
LKPSPRKGWGAFATRQIKRGSLILREKPLFIIQKPQEEITEEDVRAAYQHLPPNQKQQLLCLRDNASRSFTCMVEAFAENSFAIPSRNTPGCLVHGLFLLHSRFNHSCIPNSKIPTTSGETIARFATRDIVAGEEITFCYKTDFELRTRHERHQALQFVCDCKACLISTPFQQLSDMRRTLIRGLQYLTLGVDLNGQRQPSSSSIILDPKLKKAAEGFEIPLSSRFIYNVLVMTLLEEEELLDDFMFKQLNPSTLRIATAFETGRNARIARLAMVQETWLEKFGTALKLYGLPDVADHNVCMRLRMLHGLSV